MINDPSQFFQQLFELTLSKSPQLAARLFGGDQQGVIEILSDRLAALFEAQSDGPLPYAEDEQVVPADVLANYSALTERNELLAAALGACECWGEETDCPDCHGNGKPGWILPDPHLYRQLVLPANVAVNNFRASRRVEPQRKHHQLNGVS